MTHYINRPESTLPVASVECGDAWLGTIDGAGYLLTLGPYWGHLMDQTALSEVADLSAADLQTAINAARKAGSTTQELPLRGGTANLAWRFEQASGDQYYVYAQPLEPPADVHSAAPIHWPVGLAVADHNERVQFVNQALARIFGWPRAMFVGHRLGDLLSQMLVSYGSANPLDDLASAGLPSEHVIYRPSGERRTVYLVYEQQELAGQPAYFASLVDVTHRPESAGRTSASEGQLRDIMASIPGAVFQLRYRADRGYEVGDVSSGLRRIGGFTADQEIADFERWQAWLPPCEHDAYMDSLEQSRIHLTTWAHEWPFETPNGLIWLQGVSQPQTEADGSVVWNGVMFDITGRKRTEERLDQVETDYRVVFDQTTEGLYRSRPDGQLLDVNWPLVRMHRCDSKQDLIARIGDVSRDWYTDPEAATQLRRQVEARGEVEDFRSWIYRAGTGETFLASETARAVVNHNGQLLYYQGSVRDVTDRELMNRLAGRRSEILEMIARSQPIERVTDTIVDTIEAYQPAMATVIYRVEDDSAVLQTAPSLDNESRDAIGRQPLGDLADSSIGCAMRDGVATLDTDCPCGGRNDSASTVQRLGYSDAITMPILSQTGMALGALVALSPSTEALDDQIRMVLHEMAQIAAIGFEQSKLFDQLLEKAQYDPLTGLPNRLLLDDRIQQLIHDAERHDHSVAALMIDLDEFKLVNDTLGHAAGDQLLYQVGERLSRAMRASDTIARFGGDEFVVVVPLSEAADASQVCERVLSELHAPISVDDRELIVRTSIGIGVSPQDGDTPELLLQAADTALYSAKGAGRNQYHYFSDSINERFADRLRIESELRSAIDQAELDLFCQPSVALADEAIDGAEILLRWRHPEHGILGPGEFLPVAEQSSLIAEIDRYVIHHAARRIAAMQAAGNTWLISVNISARMLQSESFADIVVAALRASGACPSGLELEITETVVMTDFADAYYKLTSLKRRAPGIRVAMDDFGSGYSSLQYLSRLPLDTLKIDRGFVAELGGVDHDTASTIIRTIVELGQRLGLAVVAEGVEGSGQVDVLKRLGCNKAQGFWYSAAVDAASFTEAARLSPSATGFRDAVDNG